jgi:NADPH2:quinone reductase
MRTLLSKAPGGPETLVFEDAPEPQAAPGQVVVSVKAVSINYPDVLVIEDRYQTRPPRPFAPGSELAGVVKAVGAGVENLRAGDRVLATTGWGGLAEAVAIPAAAARKIPDAMPYDEAAAMVITYGTSHHALKHRADLQPGQTLLVLGAAGGVGLSAVEIGAALGARVIAACSTQEKVDVAISRGAAAGVVYGRGPLDRDGRRELARRFKDAAGAEGAHVIYDGVGGDYAEPALRAIAWEGRYLVIGFVAGIPEIPLNLVLLKGCQVVGVFWGAWTARHPQANAQAIQDLLGLYAQGRIRPYVSARFPFDRAAEAIAHLGGRQAVGKVVVTLD